MAGFALPTDLSALNSIAGASGFGYWINLGIGIILATIIGGIVLVVMLEVFKSVFGDITGVKNAFLVTLIANVINYVGVLGILLSFIYVIPYIGIILPLLVWVVLLKVFFSEMSILHVLIVAVIFYALTLLLIPMLVGMVAGYLPAF